MKKYKFNIVTDGMWGSTGKGLITSALAFHHKPDIISNTNMANAGHTIVDNDPNNAPFVAKALPSATVLKKWYDFDHHIMIGPTAAFTLETLMKEIEETDIGESLTIHPRAGVITQQHKDAEYSGSSSTKHLASTMQGCGTYMADKILRKPDLKLARDYPELSKFMPDQIWRSHLASKFCLDQGMTRLKTQSFADITYTLLDIGATFLHEGAQGYSLDINHGSHYPQCTSRGTTAIQNCADMAINTSLVGDIYLVIRPYPIRVGNVIEDGEVKGHSGGCYPDQREMSWDEICDLAGAPPEAKEAIRTKELTTVTKRLRRVFSFSPLQLKEAVAVNGATKIALNFANYIDWSVTGADSITQLTPKVRNFIDMIEETTNVAVTVIGTGPRLRDVILLG